MMLRPAMWLLYLGLVGVPALAAEPPAVAGLLGRSVLGPQTATSETRAYLESRVPRLTLPASREVWERQAGELRTRTLRDVVFRGAAAGWRDAKLGVEWLDEVEGGEGYTIRKLRYEALPGLWIPALLYEPDNLKDKVPVVLNVNGHDGNGKAARYKQVRCVNLAKRGLLALNVEWLGMGQLRTAGYGHGRMNLLDLCGTSGLAPFYLNMTRGLDVLLAHKHADPTRVAVTGLSGGGWQTIIVSALDTRVTLSNPVAGYSSFLTRLAHSKDLGDSEQTPCDLATVVDYSHLTAMMAPRPTLLTYNAKDECCFEAGYVLPALLGAARPAFQLFGKEAALRSHVNNNPGTHNYLQDNREAFYRMIRDHFYPGQGFDAREIPCEGELKSKEELDVELPEGNADFRTLAEGLARELPHDAALPTDADAARRWQTDRRRLLRDLVKARDLPVKATATATTDKDGVRATYWQLRLGEAWTLPVVELTPAAPKGTTILLNDAGRKADPVTPSRLLKAGQRVLAVDLWTLGESKPERDWLLALLLASVGERSLGLQAGQLAAVARWSESEHKSAPRVQAVGPRTCTIALTAAGLEERAIAGLDLNGSLASLKELIEQGKSVDQSPELFCFGLLQRFDVKHLAALAAPRPLTFSGTRTPRLAQEMAGLKAWYTLLGTDHDPLGP